MGCVKIWQQKVCLPSGSVRGLLSHSWILCRASACCCKAWKVPGRRDAFLPMHAAPLSLGPKACRSTCIVLTGFALQCMGMDEALNSMRNIGEVQLPDL